MLHLTKLWGRVLLHNQLLTEEQWAHALEVHEQRPDANIGQILVDEKLISPDKAKQVARKIAAIIAMVRKQRAEAGHKGEVTASMVHEAMDRSMQRSAAAPDDDDDVVDLEAFEDDEAEDGAEAGGSDAPSRREAAATAADDDEPLPMPEGLEDALNPDAPAPAAESAAEPGLEPAPATAAESGPAPRGGAASAGAGGEQSGAGDAAEDDDFQLNDEGAGDDVYQSATARYKGSETEWTAAVGETGLSEDNLRSHVTDEDRMDLVEGEDDPSQDRRIWVPEEASGWKAVREPRPDTAKMKFGDLPPLDGESPAPAEAPAAGGSAAAAAAGEPDAGPSGADAIDDLEDIRPVDEPPDSAQPGGDESSGEAAGTGASADGVEKSAADIMDEAPRVEPGDHDRVAMRIIREAVKAGASDIHLASGAAPFIRLHGELTYFQGDKLSPAQVLRMALGFMDEQQQQAFLKDKDLDFSLELEGIGRFRANALLQFRGPDLILRVIPNTPPTLKQLGLPERLGQFTEWQQGLVLVTGPAGSGKTTTAAALINLVNHSRRDHIITVEDPIEILHKSAGCNVTQRQVPVHTESFATALRAALREDPDVILIGEMRDLETMSLAIRAAETGHLVIGTLHTKNAPRTIDRIVDVFPSDQQAQIRTMLAESLRGIISQTLVPRADGKGRVAALEVLYVNTAIANLIRDSKTFQMHSVMQTGVRLGMRLMDDSLKELVDQGVITREEAAKASEHPKAFQPEPEPEPAAPKRGRRA